MKSGPKNKTSEHHNEKTYKRTIHAAELRIKAQNTKNKQMLKIGPIMKQFLSFYVTAWLPGCHPIL